MDEAGQREKVRTVGTNYRALFRYIIRYISHRTSCEKRHCPYMTNFCFYSLLLALHWTARTEAAVTKARYDEYDCFDSRVTGEILPISLYSLRKSCASNVATVRRCCRVESRRAFSRRALNSILPLSTPSVCLSLALHRNQTAWSALMDVNHE